MKDNHEYSQRDDSNSGPGRGSGPKGSVGLFSDDASESLFAEMVTARPGRKSSEVPLTIDLIQEVLELAAHEEAAYGIAEMLEIDSPYMNLDGALMPRTMNTLFAWNQILDRLHEMYPSGLAFFDKSLVQNILDAERSLYEAELQTRLKTGDRLEEQESRRYFETALYLCEHGNHKKAQAYFDEATLWPYGDLERLVSRLRCRLHHLNEPDRIIEEAEQYLSGFSDTRSPKPEEEEGQKIKYLLWDPEDESLTLFELMQKHRPIREFPGEVVTIRDLCYRLFRAEAIYLKGDENKCITQLTDIVLSLKYSEDVAKLEGRGLTFYGLILPDEDPNWFIAREIKDFCGKIARTSSDSRTLEHVDWIMSSLNEP